MKKIAKKNLKLDKEVIASLSENEMLKATGGDGTFVPESICTETWNEDCIMPIPPTKTLCPATDKNCDPIPIGLFTNSPCNAVYTNNPC